MRPGSVSAVVLVVAALAVGIGAAPAAGAATPKLQAFGSCSALERYARFHAVRIRTERPVAAVPELQTERDRASAPQSGATGGGGDAPAFSQTNVQEAGVDEPDVVKTDGRRVFAIAGGRLHAVALGGERPRLTASLDLPRAGEHQLFLHGDRVLVVSRQSGLIAQPEPAPRPGGGDTPVARPASSVQPDAGQTTLTLVDASEPDVLRVSRTLDVAGSFVDARMTGPLARLVVSSTPGALALPTERAVRAARAGRWLPRGVLRRGRAGRRTALRLAACDDVLRAPRFAGLDTLTVLTIDVTKGLTPVDSDSLMTDASAVYASKESLYLTSQRYDERATTALHRLETTGAETTYRASGAVDGTLLDQFALSEHRGVLRVATTVEAAGRDAGESFVTTLAERDGRLAVLGRVGDLGPDERIYAVRFIGDTGYVVTFREVDPLYKVDLRDPAAPRVTGELKVRGYSAYLHPVGEGLLLGVGQDADDDGTVRGTQVSLFDVSDPAAPRRLHQRNLGGASSSSEVEVDHRAFLWWPATGLAVLPLQRGGDGAAVGLRVGRDGIGEVGAIEHGGQPHEAVRRALVVGDRVLTLSATELRTSRLDTLAPVSTLALAPAR